MDLPSSKLRRSINCPKCGYENLPETVRFCPECGAAIQAAPKPAAQIEVTQEVHSVEGGQVVGVDLGEVLGDVTIGNYTLRIGSVHGGVVNLGQPQQQKHPQPRPVPVRLLPRRSVGLLDRKAEAATAITTLQSASPTEFHGPSGIGKTELLRHLAYQQFVSGFSDGVVCFSAIRHKPVEDLLLDMFDALYERETTYKPTSVQIRHALQDKRALVVLDDIELERDEVAKLMDAAPNSAFLLASTERCLWGDGQAVSLQGLPPTDALALLERELGRPLTEQEHPVAQTFCAVFEGHPLHLLQLAALMREDERTLEDLARQLLVRSSKKALTEQALAACTEQERRILAVLAAARGTSLGEQHVSALMGIEDLAPTLDSLQRRNLVQSQGPRYSLMGSLEEALREEWDLTSWNERVLEHFAQWAEQQRQAPERVAEEVDTILGILRWALQEERWQEALRLGQAVEEAVALGGQWGAWAQVLGWELQAARALGDRVGEAWALHQSGSQALCLEDTSAAHENLTEALHLRESLGDWEGASVTRHNLELLGFGGQHDEHEPEGDGSGGGDGGSSGWWGSSGGWWGPWLGIIGLVSTLVLFGLAINGLFNTAEAEKGDPSGEVKETRGMVADMEENVQEVQGKIATHRAVYASMGNTREERRMEQAAKIMENLDASAQEMSQATYDIASATQDAVEQATPEQSQQAVEKIRVSSKKLEEKNEEIRKWRLLLLKIIIIIDRNEHEDPCEGHDRDKKDCEDPCEQYDGDKEDCGGPCEGHDWDEEDCEDPCEEHDCEEYKCEDEESICQDLLHNLQNIYYLTTSIPRQRAEMEDAAVHAVKVAGDQDTEQEKPEEPKESKQSGKEQPTELQGKNDEQKVVVQGQHEESEQVQSAQQLVQSPMPSSQPESSSPSQLESSSSPKEEAAAPEEEATAPKEEVVASKEEVAPPPLPEPSPSPEPSPPPEPSPQPGPSSSPD